MAGGRTSRKRTYQYEAVQDLQEIRLLRLHPGQPEDDIRCALFHAKLGALPSYEALSYHWGDPSSRTHIICDPKDQIISITKNLGTALRTLRLRDSPRILWADAVCINQNDVTERNHQERNMRDIYHRAERVVAWIGEESDEDNAVMDFAPAVGPEADREDSQGNLFARTRQWTALSKLIKREWFNRVWIIQELAVASNLTLYYGRKSMEWESFRAALDLFLRECASFLHTANTPVVLQNILSLLSIRTLVSQQEEAPRLRDHDPKLWAAHRPDIWRISLDKLEEERREAKVEEGDLYNFVRLTRKFGASDPRDHIYALLGLAVEQEASMIVPDYGKEPSVLYRDFARLTMRQSGVLDVIGQAEALSSEEHPFPSWVPDWSKELRVSSLSQNSFKHYAASGDSKMHLVTSSDPNVLVVVGKVIGRISKLDPGFMVKKDGNASELDTGEEESVLERLNYVEEARVFKHLPLEKWANTLGGRGEASQNDEVEMFEPFALKPMNFLQNIVESAGRISEPILDHPEAKESFANFMTSMLVDLGSQLGRVVGNRIASGAPLNPAHISAVMEARCAQMAQTYCSPYPTGEDVNEAYWRTLIGDKQIEQLKMRDRTGGTSSMRRDAFLVWRESLTGLARAPLQKWLYGKKMNHPMELPESLKHLYVDSRKDSAASSADRSQADGAKTARSKRVTAREAEQQREKEEKFSRRAISRAFAVKVEQMAKNRQFCTTRNRHMGWVPAAAKVDDIICVVLGGRVPLVLRQLTDGIRTNNDYRFIGEAYIHGKMEGEAMKSKGAADMRRFRLV
ncbi:MAG: hypothetical protein M1837_003450 [Sclerophora amabilis]|nr:MAG: hypothetical protein M1837_003450 [Sclerophora amabilis]